MQNHTYRTWSQTDKSIYIIKKADKELSQKWQGCLHCGIMIFFFSFLVTSLL